MLYIVHCISSSELIISIPSTGIERGHGPRKGERICQGDGNEKHDRGPEYLVSIVTLAICFVCCVCFSVLMLHDRFCSHVNPLSSRLSFLNFHPLQVVRR